MGVGGGIGPRGARQQTHVAYYVALAGIVGLLLMLLAYFAYFCVKRVKELVQQDRSSMVHESARSPRPPLPSTTTYPVQPVVRDTASAMAKLCRQLPAPTPVYPAKSSPAAAHADQEPPTLGPAPPPLGPPPPGPEKTPAPAAAIIPRIEIDMVDAR